MDDGLWDDRWADGYNALVEITDDKVFVASHRYTDNGNFPVSVSVFDDDPNTGQASASSTIAVADVPPLLTIAGSTVPIDEGSVYTLQLTSRDPGNDTISSWQINWGDGQTQTVPGNPSSVTHTFGSASNQITATATNEDGTFTAFVLDHLLVSSTGTSQVLRFDAVTGELLGSAANGGGIARTHSIGVGARR